MSVVLRERLVTVLESIDRRQVNRAATKSVYRERVIL